MAGKDLVTYFVLSKNDCVLLIVFLVCQRRVVGKGNYALSLVALLGTHNVRV